MASKGIFLVTPLLETFKQSIICLTYTQIHTLSWKLHFLPSKPLWEINQTAKKNQKKKQEKNKSTLANVDSFGFDLAIERIQNAPSG